MGAGSGGAGSRAHCSPDLFPHRTVRGNQARCSQGAPPVYPDAVLGRSDAMNPLSNVVISLHLISLHLRF